MNNTTRQRCIISALQFNGVRQYVEVSLGETIILDNAGPGFRTAPSGAWSEAGATNPHKENSLQTTSAAATAQWTPLLPRAGTYRVYAWWGSASGSPDTKAAYVVKHASGLATNVVNQNTNSGRWTLLSRRDETFLQEQACKA